MSDQLVKKKPSIKEQFDFLNTRIKQLESEVVFVFLEEKEPIYHQGYEGTNELCYIVTADDCTNLSNIRNSRQNKVAEWCIAAFGEEQMKSAPHRAIRFLEECIELFQAAGGDKEKAHKLIDYMFDRPVGSIESEFGGVGLTLLALAHCLGVSADELEVKEFKRVLSLPLEHFAKRNKEKDDAGFRS